MDPIKEAFSKIKEDIRILASELLAAREEISNLNERLNLISLEGPTDKQTHNPTHIQTNPTHNPLSEGYSTDKQTNNLESQTNNYTVQAPYPSNSNVSIGNKGVPTDRQTDQQTDQQTQNSAHNLPITPNLSSNSNTSNYSNSRLKDQPVAVTDFQKASKILESLDSVKKAIRLKFKRLTPQEMLVFSHIYSLEEQNIDEITYKLVANDLNLSESSIRDYINKLIKKGVPIDKIRQNNKTIVLKISSDLKNIANLTTIQNLRSL